MDHDEAEATTTSFHTRAPPRLLSRIHNPFRGNFQTHHSQSNMYPSRSQKPMHLGPLLRKHIRITLLLARLKLSRRHPLVIRRSPTIHIRRRPRIPSRSMRRWTKLIRLFERNSLLGWWWRRLLRRRGRCIPYELSESYGAMYRADGLMLHCEAVNLMVVSRPDKSLHQSRRCGLSCGAGHSR